MKNVFLSACLLIMMFHASATIWRVNNQSTSTAVFTTVQAAIDDDRVSNGDTLLLEGSSEGYGSFSVDKRLVIMGTGYFLNENPKTSLEGATTIIAGTVSFIEGAQGSVLTGVLFDATYSYYEPEIRTNDILILKCHLTRGIEILGRISGFRMIQCYLLDGILVTYSYHAFQGFVLTNNIINCDVSLPTTISDPRTFAAVENNLFLGDVELTTSTYRNNIWLPLEASTINVTAGIKEYNLNVSVDMGTENNNQIINGLTDLYTGSGSTDGKWQIKSESEYKNAGKDGTDPGPFGGSNPYVLSGLPALPIIYEISTTGFGSADEGLPVTIKVRSN